MARPKSDKRVVRLSVTLNEEDHAELSRLAAKLDLSTAWVIRRAVAEFIARHGEDVETELPLRPAGIAGRVEMIGDG